MARFKARGLALITVSVFAIGLTALSFWQEQLLTVQAAQGDSTYVVEAGDSLYSIANALDVSIEALAAANSLTINSTIYKQQQLIVPSAEMTDNAAESEAAQAASTEEATEEATEEPVIEDEATPTPVEEEEAAEDVWAGATAEPTEEIMAAAEAAPAPATQSYTVKAGDSLKTIAKKFGVSVDALAAANGLKPKSGLFKNQVLIIPVSAAAAPAALPAPADVWAESTAEPTEEAMEEATAEPTEEMTEEPTEEATEEATAEPTEEMVEEPTAEATEEAVEEATAEPTEEATEEANEESLAEATAEATEEVVEEPTAEATEEAMGEATPEPTEEVMEEPIAEATEEATEEPTEEPAEEADIVDTLVELGNFTTLLATLEAADLTETLKTDGPFTLFAPTDAAFAALPEGTIDGLLAASPDDLSQILLYHIVPGAILSTDLADGVSVVTAQGGTLDIVVTADGIKVNDANITITDIETSNGVIHVINAVLLPSDDIAAVPIGTAAPATLEAASGDAASVIIVPVSITDTTAAAQLWDEPAGNIRLFSPVTTGGYHSPIELIGLSRTFEGNVAINLVASDGTLLAQRMTLGGAEEHAFFQTNLRFYVTDATEATVSMIEMDMADGSILSTLDTPITLLPGQRVIDVTSPVVGQAVCDPIVVSGYSNTFEANVVLTLSEPNGQVLAQLPTIGGSMGTYRDFATPLSYAVSEATPLLLSVTETDAAGILSTIDETVIPVTLYPAYSAACY